MKKNEAPQAASAFKTIRFVDLSSAQEPRRKALPAPIEFKTIDEKKSGSGYTETWAHSGDQRVGYAYAEERPKRELYLELVLTYPRYRGQGVGSALLREVERFARAPRAARA